MTSNKRRHPQPSRPRVCCFCNAPIAAQRPVVLLVTTENRLIGPYHAGCAERTILASKELRDRGLEPTVDFGRIIHPAREETLPW